LIVIVTLALAVGATTALGSLLNALVLRKLAVPSPEQLVALSALEPRTNVDGYFYVDTFNAYRVTQRSFADMSMYSGGGLLRVETHSGVVEDASTEAVSPSYFDIVGARLSAGRPGDCRARGAHRCALRVGGGAARTGAALRHRPRRSPRAAVRRGHSPRHSARRVKSNNRAKRVS
jgi:hypothetical protein